MARYRGLRTIILQWCYRNRKVDRTLLNLQKSVDDLNQAVISKPDRKKRKKR
ncbi:MAG: hypothetical protein ACOX8H_04105 [Ruminococcus sp.]